LAELELKQIIDATPKASGGDTRQYKGISNYEQKMNDKTTCCDTYKACNHKETKSAPGGIFDFFVNKPNEEVINDLGLTKKQARNIQKLTPEAVRETIKESKEKGEIPVRATVLKKVKEKEIIEKRNKLINLGESIKPDDLRVDIRFGDFSKVFSDIADSSVDCIITDPPYPYEFINCWSRLSEFASRVLKPHGFLIAYSGQKYLPEVLNRLGEKLNYYWTMSMYMPGKTQIVNGVNMMCRWKPILIFQKGKKLNPNIIDDYFVNSAPDKDGHDWQQGESGLSVLIEKYTKPGDLIIEPFSGAGSVLRVAQKLKRNCIGAEIDEATFNIAKARLANEYQTRNNG
jgi:site-specific DNA-methyltransferase (adenine-specific)